jgi:parallel beta-helix repeat protein
LAVSAGAQPQHSRATPPEKSKAQAAKKANQGSTYYVATNGSDSNPGTKARPFATINHAVGSLHPGDILYIRAGTYAEALLKNAPIPTGTESAPVTISGYSGETAILQPPADAYRGIDLAGKFAYLNFENFILDGSQAKGGARGMPDGIKISHGSPGKSASHVTLKGVEVRNFRGNGILITQNPSESLTPYNQILDCRIHHNGKGFGHGIYIESSHNTVRGNVIHDNGEYGVHILRSGGDQAKDAGHNIVAGNRIYHNGNGLHSNGKPANGWGIALTTGDGNVAYNNLVYGNKGGGIQVGLGCAHSRVFNNSVFDNKLNHGIEVDKRSTDAIVRNNISFGNAGSSTQIYISPSSNGSVSDHNLSIDPKWVNAARGDFHLRAGSPAIDAGEALKDVPDDFERTPRPKGKACAIGAYEFRASR